MVDGVRFGAFELRPQARQLLAGGTPVPLGGRAFDLLTALVERRERVVPRTELAALVWPQRVVEDNNLAVQVLALRRVLGEQAIATVPGRGYRFTLEVDGDEAPAPTAMSSPQHRGQPPPLLAPMHGRDEDLQTLVSLLDAQRLVTVVGAGGIGKSTLAAAAARERLVHRRDGVVWVELAPVVDAAAVAAVVGQALGLETGHGSDVAPALAHALRTRDLLLVLDSAEHLVEATARLAHHLLSGTAGIRLLVTSQAPLKVEGERVLRLGALAVPAATTPAREALDYGAVALFVDQVRAADPRFVFDDSHAGAVIDLCRRLDGLPLALKLAAARTPLFGLDELRARVDHSLRLLGGGPRDAPTRQQTLHATLDWSHGLLAPAEQTVFRRLGVFAGRFTLDAAQAVATDEAIDRWAVVEHLAALVDRSLVEADHAEAPRYRLLASAQQYALEQLDRAGETDMLRQRHAQAFAAFADAAERTLWSTADQEWFARQTPMLDDLRAALAWSVPRDTALATTLIGATGELFHGHTLRFEIRAWAVALEAAGGPLPSGPAAARYWMIRAWNLGAQDHRLLQVHAELAERHYRALGDTKGLYQTLCLRSMGIASPGNGSPSHWLDEAMAIEQSGWPPRLRSWGCVARTVVRNFEGAYEQALDAAEVGVRLADGAGAAWYADFLRGWRAAANIGLQRIDDALQDTESMVRKLRSGLSGYGVLFFGLHAQALLLGRRTEAARAVVGEMFDLLRPAEWDSMNYYCDVFVLLALREKRHDDALRLVGYADEVCPLIGLQWPRSVVFRERVVASLEGVVGRDACASLVAEGRRLDAEGVCKVTLRRVA